ncbi:Isochorismatase-like hydrolase [Glarea lozoyensis ATCC 20868]|uniref:nicotinamidase n=1 Tax=Glarea lozoyensis (strain ATCC 20868 / MF5171) TaxID=1116229 RepID=S3CXG4_GLAL2|nr:Isochorismatase-like hydrolase [Glarea lozoyensis ATCC 20868]EPE24526.1 Isochorismatase-like hydrolase [Glarea lozoyensis ATCC 20868]
MSQPQPPPNFKPALIIVDVQEDFCPPNGTLAVPNGRDIIPPINTLLTLPFPLKIATQDWHPADHISFASNHANKKPLEDTIEVVNPLDTSERYDTRLWPVHCVQGSPGAEFAEGLDVERVGRVVKKGQKSEVEMYSAFYDPLRTRVCDSGLAGVLKKEGVSHVYVTGLAGDYCVKATAVDAAKEGFVTFVVEEGVRCVDQKGWEGVKEELGGKGVKVVGIEGDEVGWVRGLSV